MKKNLITPPEVLIEMAIAQSLSYKQERRIKLVFEQMQAVKPFEFIHQITTEHIALIYRHWREVENSTPENLRKRVQYIRRLLKFATAKAYIRCNPGAFFTTPAMPQGEPVSLLDEEIEALKTTNLLVRNQAKARDLGLVQMYTGFAHIDLCAFHKSWIEVISGKRFIIGERTKTGGNFIIPLLPELLAILEKYDYKLPKYCNGYYNRLLKKVAKAAGIHTHLTSHVFRRTFGQIMLDDGISMEAVSKMLGHKSVAVTERYYVRVKMKRMIRDVLHLAA